MALVFQYGSNCASQRLNSGKRLQGAAQVLGKAQTLDEWKIAFDVYSNGNRCAAADLVPAPGAGPAWGVLYEIPDDFLHGVRADGRKTLAQIEGKRYERRQIRVRNGEGVAVDAITFLVKPEEQRSGLWTSFEYVRHIVQGLQEQGIPQDYLARVIDIAVETNRRAQRRAAEESRQIASLLL